MLSQQEMAGQKRQKTARLPTNLREERDNEEADDANFDPPIDSDCDIGDNVGTDHLDYDRDSSNDEDDDNEDDENKEEKTDDDDEDNDDFNEDNDYEEAKTDDDDEDNDDGNEDDDNEEAKTNDNDQDNDPLDANPPADGPDWNNDNQINIDVNTEMRDKFKEYCESAKQSLNMLPNLTNEEARGVKLMEVLWKKRAPLDTYDEVMAWHFRDTGKMDEDDKLKDVDSYISRETLMKRLRKRYNLDDKFPTTRSLVLPYSRAKVDLVCHDAWGCLESLLTDPRLTDDDFWFFDKDPRAPPPENQPYIADLYTGLAYSEAVKKYKTAPNKIPLPIVLYLDGANTGQMKDMPINALKMTLGIFTRKYRDNGHAWRVLGHVANISKPKSKAKKTQVQSEHIASANDRLAEGEGDEMEKDPSGSSKDLHAMLDVLLEGYRDIQKRGFIWDLRYQGKTWKDLEFVPFLIFIKCDTKEANLLCGQMQGHNVKFLCRYCRCPLPCIDDPTAAFRFKSVDFVKPLLGNPEQLKKFSLHNIENAFYKLRFSPMDSRGIHGACPAEMLHAILLGNFQYLRDTLYEQVGEHSALGEKIDSLSQLFGMQYKRQCERSIPNCQFTHGIREGKLNAKEYRGVLLVMATIFHSTTGREALEDHRDFDRQKINDWAELCEIMLCWEAFLCQISIPKRYIAKLSLKNKYLMWLIKKTAPRSKGMGLKVFKFHAILHLVKDIICFGVPLEFDTGSNESDHKKTKVAAKLTQKNRSTFDYQTATRVVEFLAISLAMLELQGEKLWEYYDNPPRKHPIPPEPPEDPQTGETIINIFEDHNNDYKPCYSLGSKAGSKNPATKMWDTRVVKFLHRLQIKLNKWIKPRLEIRTEHKRHGQIFRGHPNYRKEGPWRDWVTVDWGEDYGVQPALIWCFVVLDGLPKSNKKKEKHKDRLNHGECQLEDGVFAVIESASFLKQPQNAKASMLFRRLKLEMKNVHGEWKRKFYLVDTEAITEPLCVIPDFGCPGGCTFLSVKSRDKWADAFEHWLEEPVPQAYRANPMGRFND